MTEIQSPERGRLFFIRLIRHIRQKYVISPDKGLITRYQSVADISLIYQADTVVWWCGLPLLEVAAAAAGGGRRSRSGHMLDALGDVAQS